MGRARVALALAGALIPLGFGLGLAAQPAEPDAATRPAEALRAALTAQSQGEIDEAVALFDAVAEAHPEVADHARLLEAQALLAAGRPDRAIVAARVALERYPHSPLVGSLEGVTAQARAQLGDAAGARDAWEAALAATSDPVAQAPIRLALGRSLEQAGALAAAARQYRAIWSQAPLAPEAVESASRLDALEARLHRRLRTAHDQRVRGDALLAAGRSQDALAAYEAALHGRLPARVRREVETRRALCLFRLRRYDEAAAAFQHLRRDPRAALYHARSLARVGDADAAVSALARLGRRRVGRIAVRARLLAALLLDDGDVADRARAQRLYESVARARRAPDLAADALWHLGWSAFQAGQLEEAHARFEELGKRQSDPLDRLQARYWAARSLESSDPSAARRAFTQLARQYPFTYYGWRAAQRLNAPVPSSPPTSIDPGRSDIRERELARPRILLEAGLTDDARDELARLDAKAGGLRDRLELARLHADAGDFHGAQRLVVDAYADVLARGPARDHEELWWLAWPDAYNDIVAQTLPPDASIQPELVSAVMREESGYRPDVISPAGALGLLQIMPATGTRLARELGLDAFSPDDLFTPRTNLRIGGFYLDRLARRFDGHLAAAVASYNAGPTAVARWLTPATRADDVWVENIPYAQTRGYVKRVLRSLHVYRVLY